MSAPQTNIETQKRRHLGPLIGMVVVVLLALAALFFLMMKTSYEGTPVESQGGSIDGRTGLPTEDAVPTAPTEAIPSPAPAAPVNPPAQP